MIYLPIYSSTADFYFLENHRQNFQFAFLPFPLFLSAQEQANNNKERESLAFLLQTLLIQRLTVEGFIP